ncbi:hypothetical protein [Streptomyces sp. ISL-100]|uniref:hypothetical protein n=1 Tax=Streptomyces sp. ISL-100 TaxID=2819173 RepID=UPI001BE67391|nr:hypothetical protein [Streptomyces sp. ISL-100]MBT2401915.1 hypothetical protein [Streptomyces sp. ISL-100]
MNLKKIATAAAAAAALTMGGLAATAAPAFANHDDPVSADVKVNDGGAKASFDSPIISGRASLPSSFR